MAHSTIHSTIHSKQLAALVLIVMGVLSLVLVGASYADFGTNWTAQYYNNTDLSGNPVVTQTGLAGVNFTYGSGSPANGVNSDNFSIRFSSSQTFAGGTYDFIVTADDGVRVFIDGVNVLDRFVQRPQTTDRFTLPLAAGTHSLVVEYFESADQAMIQFQWLLVAGQPVTVTPVAVVPTSGVPIIAPTPVPVTLVPPTPLPPIPEGALTATVINARVLLVRANPYPGAPVVGRIRRGQTYAVLGRDDDARWFLLQLSGFQAWAWGYYLFIDGNEFNPPVLSAFVTTGNPAAFSGVVGQSHQVLRLRAQATSESEQIGRVQWGDIFPIIGVNANRTWYQVIYKDTTGWVTVDYVRVVEGDVNTLPTQ